MSDETKAKLSNALKGHSVSEEAIEKIRKANIGRHLSEETKKKVGEASRGRKMSEETKQKLREIHTGKHLSDEVKKKISEANKGQKWTEEQREKARQRVGPLSPFYGRHLSEETKQKISLARRGIPAWNKGVPCSEEQKRKQSEKMKGRPSNRKRKVKDLTTGIIYNSVKEAKEKTGFSHIDGCARGERNNAGGHYWTYV